ncbi:MAG: hypothetical protein AAFY88_27125, partial [Acidobacteriota bacterium]
NFTIDIDTPEATPLYARAIVIDSQGAVAEAESDRFAVADDAAPPTIDSVVAKRGDGANELLFFIGEQLRIEFRARDAETAVDTLEVSFDRDDILGGPLTATRVSGDLYRTPFVTVPPDVFFESTPVVATVTVDDFGGNSAERTLPFDVAPEPDPTAPQARWVGPWQGAEWPAAYESVSLTGATDLMLRALVTDTNLDDNDEEVPGTIVVVQFRGPVVTDDGVVELADDWTEATLVAGTDAPGRGLYELNWRVADGLPVGDLPFAVRAVDSGGRATVVSITVQAVPFRQVYESTQTSADPTNPILRPDADETGPVFLLDGAQLSILPLETGVRRSLPAVYLYTGAEIDGGEVLSIEPSVLTAPEVNSFNSVVPYTPLELEIERVAGVGHGSVIDLDGRGLLGSSRERRLLLPDMARPGVLAG